MSFETFDQLLNSSINNLKWIKMWFRWNYNVFHEAKIRELCANHRTASEKSTDDARTKNTLPRRKQSPCKMRWCTTWYKIDGFEYLTRIFQNEWIYSANSKSKRRWWYWRQASQYWIYHMITFAKMCYPNLLMHLWFCSTTYPWGQSIQATTLQWQLGILPLPLDNPCRCWECRQGNREKLRSPEMIPLWRFPSYETDRWSG